jgi:hypothetical protein
MPFKRIATDDEIEILAEQFRKLWRPGDVIRPWLRRHSDMLLELVHGDWSWSAIANALTKAGITYRTGKPWTADWLQSDFYRARVPLKGHVRKQRLEKNTAEEPFVALLPPRTKPRAQAGQPTRSTVEIPPDQAPKAEPRFKPVSIKPFEPRRPPTEEELAQIERNRMHALGRK